jgi:hypothetical protein
MYNLHWMNGCSRECCGLLVFVVQLVEVLVQERGMIYTVKPVRRIILKNNNKMAIFWSM